MSFLVAHTARSVADVGAVVVPVLVAGPADLVLDTERAELGKQTEQPMSTAVRYAREQDGGHAWLTVNQDEIGITESRRKLTSASASMRWSALAMRPKSC